MRSIDDPLKKVAYEEEPHRSLEKIYKKKIDCIEKCSSVVENYHKIISGFQDNLENGEKIHKKKSF